MTLEPHVVETLKSVSTATLTTVLLKKGLRNIWLRGTKPLKPGRDGLSARPLRCASFLPGKTSPRLRAGRRQSPRGRRSK